MNYSLSHLKELESESIYVLREAYSQFNNPCILFSGGKDSIVTTHLAQKAFSPSKIPFPLVHIDTGHNFIETIEFRDYFVNKIKAQLIVGSVQKSIDSGKAKEETGLYSSRNKLQSITLLETIEQHKFDACIGGARRDEEKARAKERFFSHRDDFGQWNPKNQRPELWNIFNGRLNFGENFRVFPISNWTELDIWQYIKEEKIELPSLYFSHQRKCLKRMGSYLALTDFITPKEDEIIENLSVRFRTMGDATITGAILSEAKTIDDIIKEITSTRTTERGDRADDKRSETAMEERKLEGYF